MHTYVDVVCTFKILHMYIYIYLFYIHAYIHIPAGVYNYIVIEEN